MSQNDCDLSLFDRSKLTEHAWLIDPNLLWRCNSSHFVELHSKWQWLSTLVLVKSQNATLCAGFINGITSRLRSLKHLMVDGFSARDFHNGTLLLLPALHSLRLEDLKGVTDQGIEQLASSRTAHSLMSLTIVDIEIASLRTVQTLLEHSPRLTKFRLFQQCSPSLLAGTNHASKSSSLASSSLQYLHWDTLYPGPATDALALSIQHGYLPALRTLKAPTDYDGALQAVCRPITKQPLTPDDMQFLASKNQDQYIRNLRLSRIQAQLRIREVKQQPCFNVVVEDAEENVQHTHVIGSYLGDVRSKVEYSLDPDLKGSESALADHWQITVAVLGGTMGERGLSLRQLF